MFFSLSEFTVLTFFQTCKNHPSYENNFKPEVYYNFGTGVSKCTILSLHENSCSSTIVFTPFKLSSSFLYILSIPNAFSTQQSPSIEADLFSVSKLGFFASLYKEGTCTFLLILYFLTSKSSLNP